MKMLLEKLQKQFAEIEFHGHVLDVSYNAVDSFLQNQVGIYDFIFHMGVATNNASIRIEFWPKNYVKGTDIENVNKEGLIDNINESFIKADAGLIDKSIEFIKKSAWMKESYDAGNYLCNYIFYQSTLKFQNSKVLFLHVSDYINNEESPDKSIQAAELFKFISYLVEDERVKG